MRTQSCIGCLHVGQLLLTEALQLLQHIWPHGAKVPTLKMRTSLCCDLLITSVSKHMGQDISFSSSSANLCVTFCNCCTMPKVWLAFLTICLGSSRTPNWLNLASSCLVSNNRTKIYVAFSRLSIPFGSRRSLWEQRNVMICFSPHEINVLTKNLVLNNFIWLFVVVLWVVIPKLSSTILAQDWPRLLSFASTPIWLVGVDILNVRIIKKESLNLFSCNYRVLHSENPIIALVDTENGICRSYNSSTAGAA